MLASMRRLHPRGRACRGIAVDANGAALGPDCVLVRRTPAGFRCLDGAAANILQKTALGLGHEPGWLFDQCRRIAEALAKGEVALAQIYGLRIPVGDLDDAALRKLADTARLIKANFDPNQARVPAGNPEGGQWTDAGGSDEDAGSADSDDNEGWPAETGDDPFDEDESFGTEDYQPDGESEGSSDRHPPPESGGGDPPPVPAKPPATTKAINRFARRVAEWLARAFALGGELADPYWKLLQTTSWLAEALPGILSYRDPPKTLEELQDAVARRSRAGYQDHHIVEGQYISDHELANWKRFRPRLETRENLVRIPYWKHIEISSWYSKPNRDYGGLTPRDYLRGKSWDEQYRVGVEALRRAGVLR
jgi:hypothetical protein